MADVPEVKQVSVIYKLVSVNRDKTSTFVLDSAEKKTGRHLHLCTAVYELSAQDKPLMDLKSRVTITGLKDADLDVPKQLVVLI